MMGDNQHQSQAAPAQAPPPPRSGPPGDPNAPTGPLPVQVAVTQPAVTLVPVLSNTELRLQFGRMMSTRRVIVLDVNPELLNRVFYRTYQVMNMTLGSVMDAPIGMADFIRVCKTIVFKRLQDIQEYNSYIPVVGAVKFARALSVPQPLGELLYALGGYFAQWNGIQYHLRPTPATLNPEPWREVNVNLLREFRRFMEMTKERYRQCSFPKTAEMTGQPLMFCVKSETDGLGRILAPGPVPTPADAFLRFIHEEFYSNPPFTVNNCDYMLTDQLYIEDVISMYVNSYVIASHG